MNRRLVSVFIFALAVALLSSFIVYRLLLASLGRAPVKAASRTAVVAVHDLEVGSLILDGDVHLAACQDCTSPQMFSDPKEIIGRGVIATIYKDEPVLAPRLAAKGAGAGLAATIPPGKRAVALRVNDVVGLAGFVLPGMRVDVIVSGSASGTSGAHDTNITRTVLQNIEVLSAGQHIERSADGKPEDVQVVNLLVTPDDAEVLTLASNETKVQLVLRNPLDNEEKATKGTSLDALLMGADYRPRTVPNASAPAPARARAAAPAPPKAAATATVEVISGVTKHEQTFDLR
jgi:pilus assembly protein CpaB